MEQPEGNVLAENREVATPENPAVETPPEVREAPVAETPVVTPPEKTEDVKPAVGSGAEKRIKQLVAEKHARDREIEQLRSQLAGREDPNVPKTPTTVDGMPIKPMPDKYTDYDEYLSDLGAWKVEVRRIQKEQDDVKRSHAESMKRTEDDFQRRLAEDSVDNPDIMAMRDRVGRKVTPAVAISVKQSDIPADLIRYLDQNPTELDRLRALDLVSAAREIGKIEVKLLAPSKTKIVSGAPPPAPIEKKGGSGASVTTQKSEDEMTTDEYMKAFRSRGKK